MLTPVMAAANSRRVASFILMSGENLCRSVASAHRWNLCGLGISVDAEQLR